MSKANTYWAQRLQKQNELNYNRALKDTDRKLIELYTNAARDLRLDILDLVTSINKPFEEILPNDLYRNNSYYQTLSRINKKLNELGAAEVEITEEKLLGLYDMTSAAVSNQKAFAVTAEDSGRRAVEKIWCPDGKHWSNRIWINKARMQESLEKGLLQCVETGLTKDKLVTTIADVCGVERKKADRLVRTELSHVQNEAAADTYSKEGVEYYEYLCETGNLEPDECDELNGQIFRLDMREIGVNFPPMHANCRCSIIPVVNW